MEHKQKKNIEWAELSTNPITGCNGPEGKRCIGCYAERIAERFAGTHGYPKDEPFRPTWHPERLRNIMRRLKATVWFFGSQCDWLDPGVEAEWREECLATMNAKSNQIFITLTKQYERLDLLQDLLPDNVILGISVTKKSQVYGIRHLVGIDAHCRVISFEPLLEDVAPEVDLNGVDWIIIGARSRQNKIHDLPAVPEFQPRKEWVAGLVAKAREAGALVFMKPNLTPSVWGPATPEYPKRTLIQEYPFEKYGDGFIYTHKRHRGYRLGAKK